MNTGYARFVISMRPPPSGYVPFLQDILCCTLVDVSMTGNDLDILSPFVLVMAATMLIEDEPGGFQLLDQDSSIHFAFLP